MDPKRYGVENSELTLGPRSGSNALKQKLSHMKIAFDGISFPKIFKNFKKLADARKRIEDADIVLAADDKKKVPAHYTLMSYHPLSTMETYRSIVKVGVGKKSVLQEGEGNGQIDAGVNAIKMTVPYNFEVDEKGFSVVSMGKGSAAQGSAEIILRHKGWCVRGRGTDNDVVTSALKATIDGCNRLHYINTYFCKK